MAPCASEHLPDMTRNQTQTGDILGVGRRSQLFKPEEAKPMDKEGLLYRLRRGSDSKGSLWSAPLV